MKTGNKGVEKMGGSLKDYVFSKAAMSGNLCEASLPPLLIFFLSKGLISFLWFPSSYLICVCQGPLVS